MSVRRSQNHGRPVSGRLLCHRTSITGLKAAQALEIRFDRFGNTLRWGARQRRPRSPSRPCGRAHLSRSSQAAGFMERISARRRSPGARAASCAAFWRAPKHQMRLWEHLSEIGRARRQIRRILSDLLPRFAQFGRKRCGRAKADFEQSGPMLPFRTRYSSGGTACDGLDYKMVIRRLAYLKRLI